VRPVRDPLPDQYRDRRSRLSCHERSLPARQPAKPGLPARPFSSRRPGPWRSTLDTTARGEPCPLTSQSIPARLRESAAPTAGIATYVVP